MKNALVVFMAAAMAVPGSLQVSASKGTEAERSFGGTGNAHLQREADGGADTQEQAKQSELGEWIAFMEGFREEEYTAKSWTALQEAICQARAVNADPFASRKEIDSAIAALIGAFGNLEYGVQKKHLETAVDAALEILDRAWNYEEETLTALRESVADAWILLAEPGVTQERIDQAAAAVIDALTYVVTDADVASLEGLIEALEGLDESKYTADSMTALKTALEWARKVLADENRKENDLILAQRRLSEAVKGLELKGNKSALNTMMEKAEEILKHASDYVPSTIRTLRAVLEDAKAVAEDENATQEEVDSVTEVLTIALARVRQKGDLDHNGEINTGDMAVLLQYTAELAALEQEQLESADVNGDGAVDTKDAVLLQQYTSEKIAEF